MRKINFAAKAVFALAVVIAGAFIWLNFSDWFIHPVFSDKAKTRHLLVISLDALNAKDYDKIKEMPNFKQLLDEGSYAKEVAGVYPSLTYPSHTSIITGKYPVSHGVVNNHVFQPGVEEPDWFWYKKDIKVPTLYDVAKKSDMKIGALLWPVTSGANNIDYNLPEIWPNKKGQNQIWLSLTNGSPFFLLDLQLRYGKIRNGTHQPELDDFVTASTCHLIETKKPNLLLVHFTDTDTHRHLYGFSSKEATDSLKRHDERLGKIMKSVKDAGIYEDTTFIVLGDHAFLDVQYKVSMNVEFKKTGLITTASDGSVSEWKAFVDSCDGSAYVYLKDKNDENTRKKVEKILETAKSNPQMGIEAVYKSDEVEKMWTGSGCAYMLEAKEGFYFTNNHEGEAVTLITPDPANGEEVATHGFNPNKPGYRTFFMASGKGVKKGVVIPSINMVDEGPTMAELLGLELPNPDGRVLSEILD